MRRKSLFFLFAAIIGILHGGNRLYADYELVNAVKEFGEKRFADTGPARLKAGPVIIHPSLKTQAEYDSNVFLKDKDPDEDVVYDIVPGIVLDLPVNKHRVTVGYEADMELFSKNRHRDQNDANQNFFALADLHFPSWYINILEQFAAVSSRAGTTFTERIPREDQIIHPKIGYRWKRLTFEGGFRYTDRRFRRTVDRALNFELTEWTGTVFYDLFARLKALVEYQLGQIEYDKAARRNGVINQVRAGLEGEVRPNVFVKARVGPQFRNYTVSSEADYYSWVGEFYVDYQIRRNLSFHVGFTRKAVEATYQQVNYYKQHLVEFGVQYRLRPQWELFGDTKLYRQDYAERSTEGPSTGYRHDNHFVYKTGIRYEPREWLEFELAYQLARRDSNFSTYDYTDHRFTLSSGLKY